MGVVGNPSHWEGSDTFSPPITLIHGAFEMTTPATLTEIFEQMAGQRIPGGCDTCDAYQTMGEKDEIFVITVHHDDWCKTHGDAAS